MAISAPRPEPQTACSIADTRHLSRLELSLNGVEPLLLGSNLRDDNAVFAVESDQSRPLRQTTPGAAQGHEVHVGTPDWFLFGSTGFHGLGLRNYGHPPPRLEVRLAVAFDSDFADLFGYAARGGSGAEPSARPG